MTYTEVKEKNGKKYFYRVRTSRQGQKFKKERIYLGSNLPKEDLAIREKNADFELTKEKIREILDKIVPLIREVLIKNKVKRAGIFGSYIRGDQKNGSDVDILIEPPEGIGFGFVRIQFELEDKLKKKVDLVSYNGLSPYLKERILSQEIRII